jgi:hypothetical protein
MGSGTEEIKATRRQPIKEALSSPEHSCISFQNTVFGSVTVALRFTTSLQAAWRRATAAVAK